MDVRAGKKRHDLAQYIFQKGERGFIGAKYIGRYPPKGCHTKRLIQAAQFGIRRDGSLGMSGHFNLGNDCDETFAGVLHNVFNFFLGIKPAVFLAVKFALGTLIEVPNDGFVAPGCN